MKYKTRYIRIRFEVKGTAYAGDFPGYNGTATPRPYKQQVIISTHDLDRGASRRLASSPVGSAPVVRLRNGNMKNYRYET